MNCPHCEATLAVRKSLKRGKSDTPDDCPECGEPLEEDGLRDRDLLTK